LGDTFDDIERARGFPPEFAPRAQCVCARVRRIDDDVAISPIFQVYSLARTNP
jgi:hypothetical protein